MGRRASPGEGRPYQRSADGLWVVVVRDADNRRRCLYAGQKVDVVAKRDEWNAAIRVGLTPPTGRLSTGRILDDWLADRFGKVRPATWVSYEGMVRIHLESLARIPVARLTPADVRRLLRERVAAGCAPRTVAYALTVLRMALNQARRDGVIARNVAELVDPPRRTRAALRVWTDREARRFLEATSADPLGPLWAILLGTACRRGEALGLRWADVDFATGMLTISGAVTAVDRRVREPDAPRLERGEPKTEESWRTIAAATFVLGALRRQRDATAARPANRLGLVFTTPRGTPLDPRNVTRRFEAAIANAGVPRIRVHDLRHTAIALLLARGYTLEDVRRMVGHSSIVITSDTYGHLVEGRSREVAAGMDLAIGGAG